jgi:hypothetical protein
MAYGTGDNNTNSPVSKWRSAEEHVQVMWKMSNKCSKCCKQFFIMINKLPRQVSASKWHLQGVEDSKKPAYNTLEHLLDIFHLIRKMLNTTVKNIHKCSEASSSESKYFLHHLKGGKQAMYVCVVSEVINE